MKIEKKIFINLLISVLLFTSCGNRNDKKSGFVQYQDNWNIVRNSNSFNVVLNYAIKTNNLDERQECAKLLETLCSDDIERYSIFPAEHYVGDIGHHEDVYYYIEQDYGCCDVDLKNVLVFNIDSIGMITSSYNLEKCIDYKYKMKSWLLSDSYAEDLPTMSYDEYADSLVLVRQLGIVINFVLPVKLKTNVYLWLSLFELLDELHFTYDYVKNILAYKNFKAPFIILKDDERDYIIKKVFNGVNITFSRNPLWD